MQAFSFIAAYRGVYVRNWHLLSMTVQLKTRTETKPKCPTPTAQSCLRASTGQHGVHGSAQPSVYCCGWPDGLELFPADNLPSHGRLVLVHLSNTDVDSFKVQTVSEDVFFLSTVHWWCYDDALYKLITSLPYLQRILHKLSAC